MLVAPVLQVIVPEHDVAVNKAVSVPQRLVLSAVKVGAAGFPPVDITIALDTELVPHSFLQVAV